MVLEYKHLHNITPQERQHELQRKLIAVDQEIAGW